MTVTPTDRLGINVPDGNEDVLDWPATAAQWAAILDNAMTFGQGAFVDRPEPGLIGRVYLATDDLTDSSDGTLWVDFGTTWRPFHLSGAAGAFSAKVMRFQTIAADRTLTIVFDAEEHDVSGWYDATTGIYTPRIPGIYHFDVDVEFQEMKPTLQPTITVRRGTSAIRTTTDQLILVTQNPGDIAYRRLGLHFDARANGTTDAFYVEAQNLNGGSTILPISHSFFSAHLVGRL